MEERTWKNENIFNNMGGGLITEDGLYLESVYALGNMIHAYPNRCGRAEVEVVKKSLSQLVHEDEQIQETKRKAELNAIVLSIVLTLTSIVLAVFSKNTWVIRSVFYFWVLANLNGFFGKSAMYYGRMLANWSKSESKKYNYAFSQVLNYAKEKNDIPTMEEAAKESPYSNVERSERFAESFNCIVRSIADMLVLLAISTCVKMLWLGNSIVPLKILLTIVFLAGGGTMMNLHKGFISDWFEKLKYANWFIVLAEKPFLEKPDKKHYDIAISALMAYRTRESYILEHIEEYVVASTIIDLREGKLIITLVNGDVTVIYL